MAINRGTARNPVSQTISHPEPIVSKGILTLAFAFLLLGIGNIFISLQLRKVKGKVGDLKEDVLSAADKLKRD